MRFTIRKAELQEVLSILSPIPSERSLIGIAKCFHFYAVDRTLKIVAINSGFTIWASAETRAIIDEPGTCTINAQIFSRYLKEITADALEIYTVEKSPRKVKVQWVDGKRGVGTFPFNDDVYEFPDDQPKPLIELEASDLVDLFAATLYATAPTEHLPALNCGRLVFKPDHIIAMGSDGYRVAIKHLEAYHPHTLDLLIPVDSCHVITKALGKASGQVILLQTPNDILQFMFRRANGHVVTINTVTVDAKYPNVDNVIPASFSLVASADQDELTAALHTAQIYAREDNDKTSFIVGLKEIQIIATAQEYGDTQIKITCHQSIPAPEPLAIYLNAQYIQETLHALGGAGEVLLCFTDSRTPVTIYRAGVDRANEQHIIMPIHNK